jgi:hypothetical protein
MWNTLMLARIMERMAGVEEGGLGDEEYSMCRKKEPRGWSNWKLMRPANTPLWAYYKEMKGIVRAGWY